MKEEDRSGMSNIRFGNRATSEMNAITRRSQTNPVSLKYQTSHDFQTMFEISNN